MIHGCGSALGYADIFDQVLDMLRRSRRHLGDGYSDYEVEHCTDCAK